MRPASSARSAKGGVAVDTVEDMVRLYDGFDLGSPDFSASMTISGPAPIIMAMYIAAAKRRFGDDIVPKTARHHSGRHLQGSSGAERNHLPGRSLASFL